MGALEEIVEQPVHLPARNGNSPLSCLRTMELLPERGCKNVPLIKSSFQTLDSITSLMVIRLSTLVTPGAGAGGAFCLAAFGPGSHLASQHHLATVCLDSDVVRINLGAAGECIPRSSA